MAYMAQPTSIERATRCAPYNVMQFAAQVSATAFEAVHTDREDFLYPDWEWIL